MKIIFTPVLRQYVIIITVNLLIICVGLDLGWTSPVLVKLRDPAQSPLSHVPTDDQAGWIVSIGYIVTVFTLPFIGMLLDYVGRRTTILMIWIPKIAAGLMTVFGTEIWIILVSRAISGVITIASYVAIMVYTTEISSKEIRGALGSLVPIFSNLGLFLILTIGPYISYLNLCIMVTAVNVCASIPQIFIPDSPYSLYKKGKIDEARKVLTLFRGSQEIVEEELNEMSQAKPSQNLKLRDFFKNKVYLKTVAVILVLAVGSQIIGFNFISFYLQSILEFSNTTVSPELGSAVIGIIQITSSILAGIFTDRCGRRPILISTFLTLALGMVGLGAFFMVKQHCGVYGVVNYLPLLCIAVISCSYSGGIGSIYFMLVTELVDDPIRAQANTGVSVVSTLFLFLLTRYAMNIWSTIGPASTFIIFGVINIMMSLFTYFFIPETKQKTIAEIQKAFGKKEDVENKNDVTKF